MPWDEHDLDGLSEDERVRVQDAYLASQLSARLDQGEPSILEWEQLLEGARLLEQWITGRIAQAEHTDLIDVATQELADLASVGEHDTILLVPAAADGGPVGELDEVPVDIPFGPSWVRRHAWRLPCRARILAALEANRDGEDEDEGDDE